MKEKITSYKKKFEGTILKIVKPVATISFTKTIYHPKFERYSKKTIKIKARIPSEMSEKVKVGDYVSIMECRPLSKTVHHILIEIKNNSEKNKQKK